MEPFMALFLDSTKVISGRFSLASWQLRLRLLSLLWPPSPPTVHQHHGSWVTST